MEELLSLFYTYKDPIFIIALSVFLGVQVIACIPSVLHTPLMSGANAISGVIIVGGIILVGHSDPSGFSVQLILGIMALILGTLNVVGGFVVTDRMLEMFIKKKRK